MQIRKLDRDKLEPAYNILCQGLYPWKGVVDTPFGAAWAVVEPGQSTKRHQHHDGETFFIVQGRGRLTSAEGQAEVAACDVCYLPPFTEHTLTNDGPEPLVFLTVWWEDLKLLGRAEPEAPSRSNEVMVTAAPPTPNGDLHLGHLSGPYLAADICCRYLRLRGSKARYVTGSDDNQSYIALMAAQLGEAPQALADRMAGAILETLRAARMDVDLFVRPNASPHHQPLVEQFVRRLYDSGALVAEEAAAPYCETCRRYLFEAYITGRCPHCEAPTGGNGCEDCGLPNACSDLVDPRCVQCGGRPSSRSVRRLYFPVHEHAAALRRFHAGVAMPPHLGALCERALATGPRKIAISHPSDWGLPVPVPGFEDQRLYDWCEMAPRYLAYGEALAARDGRGDWQHQWKNPEAEVVQCFGFDNGYFYAILVPALLLAYDPAIRLPTAFLMNEFYRLDGAKFSTSRRHAIWGKEILAAHPADDVRFYLAYSGPETERTNFTQDEFQATVRRELRGSWQRWLHGLEQRVMRFHDGKAPATGDWTAGQRRFYDRLLELNAALAQSYEARTFSPQRATRLLGELVREAQRFAAAEEHWRIAPERQAEHRTAIALELLAAKLLAVGSAPILPDFSAHLWASLGHRREPSWEDTPSWVPAGQPIGNLHQGGIAHENGGATPTDQARQKEVGHAGS